MKPAIAEKLESLVERYEELQQLLGCATIIQDQVKFRALSKEYSQLTEVVQTFKAWRQLQVECKELEILTYDAEMGQMAVEELKQLQKETQHLSEQLQILLLPKDQDDEYSCFLEIRAAAGGDEAALFAGALFRLYYKYAENHRWHVEILSQHEGDHGGYKEMIAKIVGEGAYGRLKFESGGHRVQRVPTTESQGRIHTSTCTVAILPELPQAELPEINPADLRIDTFRSSGAGGQHVNTTDSAIRITHLPTGMVVECQAERSQHKNRAKAMAVLGTRLRDAENQRRQQSEASTRRNLLGSGERSDRIRTYNYPQSRITDHRINLTLYRLNEALEGELDMLIEPIMHAHQADQLAELAESAT